MKYLLLIIVVAWVVGCKEKSNEDNYEWVQISHADTVYFKGGYMILAESFVRKRKDETLDQCLDRMDSLYGRSPFRMRHVSRLHDFEIEGEAIDQNSNK